MVPLDLTQAYTEGVAAALLVASGVCPVMAAWSLTVGASPSGGNHHETTRHRRTDLTVVGSG